MKILCLKELVALLTFAVLLAIAPVSAQAQGNYYTFTGNISTVDNNYGLLDPGISLGDSVTYTMFIDLSTIGSYTRNNGLEEYYGFYTDYIGGNALPEYHDGGRYNGPYDIAEYNYGSWNSGWGYTFYAQSADNWLWITQGDSLTVGTFYTVGNEIWNAAGFHARIYADVTLVDISATDPTAPVVPEPISSALFLVGSATLGFRQWRKKKAA